jgi:phage replication initiation protein
MSKRVGTLYPGSLDPANTSGSAGALAAAARSPGEDGTASAASPRLVIRGETSVDSVSAHIDGNPLAAFTDWLNVTYPAQGGDPGAFFNAFSKATRATFGGMLERPGRGLHGYTRSFEFQHGRTLFAFGGQRGTAFISMSGDGCALVPDWPALVALLRDQLQGRITRWDGAADDYEGRQSVDEAVRMYRAGGFGGGGRKPTCSVDGDWIDPTGRGRTFYVGNRKNGKLLRVYAEGRQAAGR